MTLKKKKADITASNHHLPITDVGGLKSSETEVYVVTSVSI